MKNKTIQFTLLTALYSSSPLLLAEVSGKMIAYTCQTCHDAKSGDRMLIQTLSEDEIIQKLLNFKYDRKRVTIMNRISKGYTDSELEAVAQYLSRSD